MLLDPVAFVAVIVNVVVGKTTVAAPEITPVVVLKDKPAGNVPPLIEKPDATPPVLIGVAGVIVAPTE